MGMHACEIECHGMPTIGHCVKDTPAESVCQQIAALWLYIKCSVHQYPSKATTFTLRLHCLSSCLQIHTMACQSFSSVGILRLLHPAI